MFKIWIFIKIPYGHLPPKRRGTPTGKNVIDKIKQEFSVCWQNFAMLISANISIIFSIHDSFTKFQVSMVHLIIQNRTSQRPSKSLPSEDRLTIVQSKKNIGSNNSNKRHRSIFVLIRNVLHSSMCEINPFNLIPKGMKRGKCFFVRSLFKGCHRIWVFLESRIWYLKNIFFRPHFKTHTKDLRPVWMSFQWETLNGLYDCIRETNG